jgi:signal transduction histidine kinase
MNSKSGLARRLGRAFLLQAGLICIVAVLGIFASGFILKEVMIQQALSSEAEHFWRQYRQNPQFQPPATLNLKGYLVPADDLDSLPVPLRVLGLGRHHLDRENANTQVYVTEQGALRLYLVFDGERVSQLATYFGLVPLAAILIVLYLAAWAAHRMSQRAVSPIIWLAREVNRLDPQAPDTQALAPENLPGEGHQELWVLAAAIKGFAERLNAFVERERNFTRDASHELRSPLTVIKMASELLLNDPRLSPSARQSAERIQRCAGEMQDLVEIFLLLARESDGELPLEPVCINHMVEDELNRAQLLAGDKPISVSRVARFRLTVHASSKVLSVLIGNLLRNAFSYTDAGRVCVQVAERELIIEDSGIGIPEQQVKEVFRPFFRGNVRQRGGYGVGLTIVKRLSDRFHWPIQIESEPGVGTRVVVRFPDAECERLDVE